MKAKMKSKTRPARKAKKRAQRVARPAAAESQAIAESPAALPVTPDRKAPTPFLFWATIPFRMMEMWFGAHAPKR